MKLVIVESPSKAKTIQKYLGSDYMVVASGGHICDLPKRSLGIKIDNGYKPEYTISDSKKEKLIGDFKKLVKKASAVYIATDPDREGEAIGWHLANHLNLNNDKNRITFDEISKNAVEKAILNPRSLNMDLVNAQQARRVIDRLVGYKVSPILSRKIKSGLSGGRVQSAVLRMLIDRENEIERFNPEEFWTISANLQTQSKSRLKASYYGKDGKKNKVTSKEQADKIESECTLATWKVSDVKKSKSMQRPYAPFTTSTMQQDASIKLGMSSSTIMRVAQQLYEGFEIEGYGHMALVTYIRSDSVRVSPEFQSITAQFISNKYGQEYVPSRYNIYKTKSQAQDAHEAIRPISLDITPEELKDRVSNQQYRLYKLIYERYIASQMSPARFNTFQANILAQSNDALHIFKISGKQMTFDGFTIVGSSDSDTGEDHIESTLPKVEEGEELNLESLSKEQKFTQPPSRYTEASLIKTMEENGIGRPSTYATAISTLLKRKYMQKEKKSLKPTDLGNMVNQFMLEHFSDIVDINFTAKIEKQLDEIEHGKVWQKVLEDFYPKFSDDVDKAQRSSKVHIEAKVSDVKCEKCGTFMVYMEGRHGPFLACPNFPTCRNTKSINEPLGPCKKCGEGQIVQRRTKSGRIFYGCNAYPKCDFVSWNKPKFDS